MTTYNHDEFFKWLDEGPEESRRALNYIFDNMAHPSREELSEIKADGILRNHFVTLEHKKTNSSDYMSIEMLYRLDKTNIDVTMSVIKVTIYDDLNQLKLYESIEQTQSPNCVTGKSQMN